MLHLADNKDVPASTTKINIVNIKTEQIQSNLSNSNIDDISGKSSKLIKAKAFNKKNSNVPHKTSKDRSARSAKRGMSAKHKKSCPSDIQKCKNGDKHLSKLLHLLNCSNSKEACVKVRRLIHDSDQSSNIIEDLKDKIKQLEKSILKISNSEKLKKSSQILAAKIKCKNISKSRQHTESNVPKTDKDNSELTLISARGHNKAISKNNIIFDNKVLVFELQNSDQEKSKSPSSNNKEAICDQNKENLMNKLNTKNFTCKSRAKQLSGVSSLQNKNQLTSTLSCKSKIDKSEKQDDEKHSTTLIRYKDFLSQNQIASDTI